MKTPKKTIKKAGTKILDVKDNLKTFDPKGTKHVIDDEDEDFDEPLDDLGGFDDLNEFDEDDDEY